MSQKIINFPHIITHQEDILGWVKQNNKQYCKAISEWKLDFPLLFCCCCFNDNKHYIVFSAHIRAL